MKEQPLPKLSQKTDIYDTFFRITMWWRIVWGVIRLIAGFGLLHLVGHSFSAIFYSLLSHEIVEDPSDLLVRILNLFALHTSYTITYFFALYLIFWGIVDIFLPVYLLLNKLWAFQASLYIIGIFVLYEIYRFTQTHSLFLIAAIAVDLLTLWLIRREEVKLLKKLRMRS